MLIARQGALERIRRDLGEDEGARKDGKEGRTLSRDRVFVFSFLGFRVRYSMQQQKVLSSEPRK